LLTALAVKVSLRFASASSVSHNIKDLKWPFAIDVVNEETQLKSLEHVVDRAGLKTAPRLEKIFD